MALIIQSYEVLFYLFIYMLPKFGSQDLIACRYMHCNNHRQIIEILMIVSRCRYLINQFYKKQHMIREINQRISCFNHAKFIYDSFQ